MTRPTTKMGLHPTKNALPRTFVTEMLAQYGVDAGAIRGHIQDNPPQPLGSQRASASLSRYFGKYRGVVVNNADPERCGRVQASVPVVQAAEPLSWALPCTPYPAPGSTTLSVPPPGASVWIEFEGGDPQRPIWSGCPWNPGQTPCSHFRMAHKHAMGRGPKQP